MNGAAPSVSSPVRAALPPHLTVVADVCSVSSEAAFGVAACVAVGGPTLVAASLARTSKKYSSPLVRPVAS